jgi:hypothetical protein
MRAFASRVYVEVLEPKAARAESQAPRARSRAGPRDLAGQVGRARTTEAHLTWCTPSLSRDHVSTALTTCRADVVVLTVKPR